MSAYALAATPGADSGPVADTSPTVDEAWIRALRRREPAATRWLYERYRGMVHGIIVARAPAEDVEDLVQDAFARALANLGTLRSGDALGGWLAAIARNRVTDHLRTRRPTRTLDREPTGHDAPVLEAARVLEALQSLPPAYAEPLAMRLIAGMTGPEIAERTGLTHGSVRVNLHRGLRRLRRALGMEEP